MAKILIIDDEPLVLAYLRKRLESNRHEVSELASGVDASRIQRERSFELVITDIFMPDEDGLQTITRLRGEDPDLPIIAMSGGATGTGGSTQESMLQTAKILGAKYLLEKPFGINRLHEVVSEALSQ